MGADPLTEISARPVPEEPMVSSEPPLDWRLADVSVVHNRQPWNVDQLRPRGSRTSSFSFEDAS